MYTSSTTLWGRLPFLFIYALALVLWFALSHVLFSTSQLSDLSSEDHVIENLSVYGLLIAAIAGVYAGWISKERIWFLFAFFMLFAMLRELDVHSAFMTMSILKSRFYVSPEVPFHEKMIGGAVLLLLACGIYKALRTLPFTLKRLLNGDSVALAAYTAFGIMCVAKFIDSSSRLMPSLAPLRLMHDVFLVYIEENLEMFMGMTFAMAPLIFIYGYTARQGDNDI